jgi:hypothetical protein
LLQLEKFAGKDDILTLILTGLKLSPNSHFGLKRATTTPPLQHCERSGEGGAFAAALKIRLKGQCHEMVVEVRPWSGSLALN